MLKVGLIVFPIAALQLGDQQVHQGLRLVHIYAQSPFVVLKGLTDVAFDLKDVAKA